MEDFGKHATVDDRYLIKCVQRNVNDRFTNYRPIYYLIQ
jgi:hypothetical protein